MNKKLNNSIYINTTLQNDMFHLEIEHKLVKWKKFNRRINYSSCNEDTSSEIRALNLNSKNRVLCIAAGGGRVLNLLADNPGEIWAVDVNPCQCYLLEL